MAIHDHLAHKAIAMGKTSAEFSAAAQRHANTTWILVVVAGVVWYFVGWVWTSIPIALGVYSAIQSISSSMIATRLENHETHFGSAEIDFVGVVQAYGKILETSAPLPGTVADSKKLPYPKQRIKEAIVAALRTTSDSHMKEQLKVAYVRLADWQEGVGEANQGVDVSKLDICRDTESVAKTISEQTSTGDKWSKIVQEEEETLKRELQSLALW